MDILDKLIDLHKQATTERSHHYVAGTCHEAMAEITRLRMRVERLSEALSGLLEAPSGDLYTHTEQNELMRAKADAMRALGITQ